MLEVVWLLAPGDFCWDSKTMEAPRNWHVSVPVSVELARVCGACQCASFSLSMETCVMAALAIEDEVLVALLDNAERTRVRLG